MKFHIRVNPTVICGLFSLLLAGCEATPHTGSTDMAFIDNEPPDFSGFSQKSDDLAIVRTELGVSNEDINAFYYLAGSKKTIIKVELSAMPCAVLLKKNKTSSGVFWSLFDMGCDDSHED